jgi:hypothetical protein
MAQMDTRRPECLAAFERLFLAGYGLTRPVLPLERLIHWQAHMEVLAGLAGHRPGRLGTVPCLVAGGYFYNFSNPAPEAEALAGIRDRARAEGVGLIVVPTVWDDDADEPLARDGYVPVPWFVESAFELKGDLEDELRRGVGPARFRELRRLWRKANREYGLRWMSAEDMEREPAWIAELARLHDLNMRQHGFSINLYSEAVIRALLDSPLRCRVAAGFRVGPADGRAVQCMLTMRYPESGELYYLVQGIDHDRVPLGHNLYVAGVYDLFAYAEAHSYRSVWIGRGAHDTKRRLGANRFLLQNNWFRTGDAALREELRRLAGASLAALGLKAGDGIARRRWRMPGQEAG